MIVSPETNFLTISFCHIQFAISNIAHSKLHFTSTGNMYNYSVHVYFKNIYLFIFDLLTTKWAAQCNSGKHPLLTREY